MFNLLTEGSNNNSGSGFMIFVLIAVFVAYMVYSNRLQKKRQKETQDTLNAIKPGNKVKTIGGICGVVVEVCAEDNTIVLETGTEKSGKSYITFDKQAVYQTDALANKDEKVETPAEEPATETVATEEPVVETVATETEETATETNE